MALRRCNCSKSRSGWRRAVVIAGESLVWVAPCRSDCWSLVWVAPCNCDCTASLEQVLPVYHLLVTGMLVWCVGTCPHAAHRQFFVDGLITWIAHPPHLRVCCIIVPLAVASLPTQPYNVASCTSSNRVLLAVRLAWTSVSLALFLQCSTHAQSTPACWQ